MDTISYTKRKQKSRILKECDEADTFNKYILLFLTDLLSEKIKMLYLCVEVKNVDTSVWLI